LNYKRIRFPLLVVNRVVALENLSHCVFEVRVWVHPPCSSGTVEGKILLVRLKHLQLRENVLYKLCSVFRSDEDSDVANVLFEVLGQLSTLTVFLAKDVKYTKFRVSNVLESQKVSDVKPLDGESNFVNTMADIFRKRNGFARAFRLGFRDSD
jgi:hypothetical protein